MRTSGSILNWKYKQCLGIGLRKTKRRHKSKKINRKSLPDSRQETLCIQEIGPETKIIGVFGYPVKHSASPAMHNAAFRVCGLDCVYLAFEIKPENLRDALLGLPALGICGVNLTIPHKEKATQYMNELSKEVIDSGAVNTVVIESGKLKGYNTDIKGFLKSLSEDARFAPEGKKVVILGAGGGSRAVLFALAPAGVSEVTIASKPLKQADKLAAEIAQKFPEVKIKAIPFNSESIRGEISSCSLLVNATPLGMKGEIPISNTECLHEGLTVYDLIYTPLSTPLLEEARGRGAKTINGLSMLVYQGAASFKLWTGKEPPISVMKQAAREAVRGRVREGALKVE